MNLEEYEGVLKNRLGGRIHISNYIYKLGLWEGEFWLSTETQKMTWYEAVEIVANRSDLRLPYYSDLIRAVKNASEEDFPTLEEGEFWSGCSERYDPNSDYACCLTEDHKRYTSHNKKSEKKWVRFIKFGKPEDDIQNLPEEKSKFIKPGTWHSEVRI